MNDEIPFPIATKKHLRTKNYYAKRTAHTSIDVINIHVSSIGVYDAWIEAKTKLSALSPCMYIASNTFAFLVFSSFYFSSRYSLLTFKKNRVQSPHIFVFFKTYNRLAHIQTNRTKILRNTLPPDLISVNEWLTFFIVRTLFCFCCVFGVQTKMYMLMFAYFSGARERKTQHKQYTEKKFYVKMCAFESWNVYTNMWADRLILQNNDGDISNIFCLVIYFIFTYA